MTNSQITSYSTGKKLKVFSLRSGTALAGGPVDSVPAYKPKGRQFNSQSRLVPGLWAKWPVRGT